MSETNVYLAYGRAEPTLVKETTYLDGKGHRMRDRLFSDGSWSRVLIGMEDHSRLICDLSDYRIPGPHPEPFLLT